MSTPLTFSMKKVTHVGYGVMVLIILATLALALWGIHQTVGTFEAVIHTEEVSAELLRVFADLKEAEDQQREYLLTGNTQFLAPYHQAVERTQAGLNTLENLTLSPARQARLFPDFKNLILRRLTLLQKILDIRDTQGTQSAIESLRSGEGMQLTAKIRQEILDFHKEDVANFTRLHDTAHRMERFTVVTLSMGLLLTFSVCLFIFWKFRRDLMARQQLERRLLKEAKLAEVSRRIADIGHDVKNMLTPIQMGMQLLEDELDEHFRTLPDLTGTHSLKTQGLYKDIIGMTRRGSSRIQMRVKEIADAVKGVSSSPQFAACHLGKIVESVLEALRLNAEEREITLQSQGLDALPILKGDEQRLFNAFYNLINNAIPEVPPGGSVTITGTVSPDGKNIILSFQDTGRGMPPDVLNSLFTYQVVSRKPGGTGLGTKIVKDVVDAHGGTIRVDSTEGKGTTFTIGLPKEGPEPQTS